MSSLLAASANQFEKVDLATFSGRALVLIFVSTDCPISNSYAPEINRLKTKYEKKGIVFRLVYPNADETEPIIRKHLEAYKLDLVPLRDPKHEWVRKTGVRVTPEAAVYLRDKGWVYHGRIDDRYAAFGKARAEAQHHELRDVLAKIAEEREIAPSSTTAVGCYIEQSK
jgi:thiol-disulfide isomerase/thioredoxin